MVSGCREWTRQLTQIKDATLDTSMVIRRPSRTSQAYTPRSLQSISAPSEAPWEAVFITVDQSTSTEIRTLLSHFGLHLTHLLSPLPLPGVSIRSKGCLDRALLCYSKLAIFSDAGLDACAVLYSLLAMSAAHMNAVFQGFSGFSTELKILSVNPSGAPEGEEWHAAALRFARLTQTSLDRTLRQKQLSKSEHKNVVITLLNMILSTVGLPCHRGWLYPISNYINRR